MGLRFQIFDFSEERADALKRLWLEFVQDPEGSDMMIEPIEENADYWMKFVKTLISQDNGTLNFAVDEQDDEVIGYVLYAWSGPLKLKVKQGIINNLYVKPAFWGAGVGTALLSRALKVLREHGVSQVRVTVMTKNYRAIELYERFGFREALKIMELSR